MSKMITAALVLMLGLTGFNAYCLYSIHKSNTTDQAQAIQKLRADVDQHTRYIMFRSLAGALNKHDNQVLAGLHDSTICEDPSDDIKDVCETSLVADIGDEAATKQLKETGSFKAEKPKRMNQNSEDQG